MSYTVATTNLGAVCLIAEIVRGRNLFFVQRSVPAILQRWRPVVDLNLEVNELLRFRLRGDVFYGSVDAVDVASLTCMPNPSLRYVLQDKSDHMHNMGRKLS